MPATVVSRMLRDGLVVRVIGRRLLFYQTLTSTMDEAARLALEGIEEGTVVVAEKQTAGRGRYSRTWVSPEGNLLLSIVLRPSLYSLRYLSILAGLASARAVSTVTGLNATIKWPNDVRLAGKKVGGILVENSLQGNEVNYAVVGIGLNVIFDPRAHNELAETATGLSVEADKSVSREDLLRHLLQESDNLYHALRKGEPPVADWRERLDTLGRQVSVQVRHLGPASKPKVYRGLAEDVDAAGNLLLRTSSGRRIALPAGEVTLQEG